VYYTKEGEGRKMNYYRYLIIFANGGMSYKNFCRKNSIEELEILIKKGFIFEARKHEDIGDIVYQLTEKGYKEMNK